MAACTQGPWRYVILVATIGATVALDLGTKRWAENNLATPDHMLPFSGTTGTVGDLIRERFVSMTDRDLSGAVLRVPATPGLSPDQDIVDVAARHPGLRGFVTFDRGRAEGFGRFVDVPNDEGRNLRDTYAGVTLAAHLSKAVGHLSDEEIAATATTGTFPIAETAAIVTASTPVDEASLYLLMRREIVVIPGFWDYSYVENPAGAFSMLSSLDEGKRRMLFYTLSLIVIAVLIYLLIRPPSPKIAPQIALGAILGGAIGNLVDRFQLNYVVDFIHMFYGSVHWPRYNIADIGITVGIVVLLLTTGFSKKV